MSLFTELKRRNVFRVGATYAVLAWVLMQVADIVLPAFNAPQWVLQVFLFFLILGFPLALVLSWAYELTPDGIKTTADVDAVQSIRQQTGDKLNYVFIGSVVLLFILIAVDHFDDGPTQPTTASLVASETPTPADPAAQPAAAVAAEVIPDSIAVLPFANLSPNPDDAYFAAGLHDEILNQLTKLRNLKVISRQSVLRYADSQLSIAEIAQELRVSMIMEGSVRYAADRIRVTAQLIDPVTDEHLWSETFEMPFADVFAAETSIAMNVANAMQVNFSPEEAARLEQPRTANPQAYALFLEAMARMSAFMSDEMREEQLRQLDRVLSLDPDFARAWMAKAAIYAARGDVPLLRESLARAKALDPDLENWERIEMQVLALEGRTVEAEALLDGLLERYPNDLTTLGIAADLRLYAGRFTEALAYELRVVELDPADVSEIRQVGFIYSRMGQYENALGYLTRASAMVPTSITTYLEVAFALAALGRHEEALEWIRSAETLTYGVNGENEGNAIFSSAVLYAHAISGRTREINAEFEKFLAWEDQADLPTRARAYISAGKRVEGLALMEQMVGDNGNITIYNWIPRQLLKFNPHKLAILDEPEFVEVRSRL